MTKLPKQLEWRNFRKALAKLGYELTKSGSGSVRHYYSVPRESHFTCHEPHQPATIPGGTLKAYLRQLGVSVEEFLDLLD